MRAKVGRQMSNPFPERVAWDELLDDGSGTYYRGGIPFTGLACECFADGRVRSEAHLVDGHQNGLATEWYQNGQIMCERMYLGDGLHGVSKEWYTNGQLKSELVCEYGVCLESKEWDDKGLLTKHFHLQRTDPDYEILTLKRSIWAK
jgi:antitoxin component YwqK of YwqJK toxin-antitoxin module